MNIKQIAPTASVHLADVARKMELEGKQIIKFQTGDPDFATHPAVITAANEAMQAGFTHYSFAQGLPALRQAIAASINSEVGTELTEKNILVTQGAVQGINAIFTALLEYGDEVLVLEPNWPTIDSVVTINGAKPVKINFLETKGLVEVLEEAYSTKTKAITFNTPNNPTGTVINAETLQAIVDWAVSKNIYIIADEVYRYLQYSEKTTSLQTIASYDKYIFVDSFSKKYAMTGWRIGYVAASEDCIKDIAKAGQINITHVAPFVQYAAIAALHDDNVRVYCADMYNTYKERRDYVVAQLDKHDIEYLPVDGAFYVFIKLPQGEDDVQFADALLRDQQVCVVPGSAYGKSSEGYIRIAYSVAMQEIEKGLERIIATINNK